MFVGSCQHDIDESWYNDDASSYIVIDRETGVCSNVTTCKECKQANEEAGLILDENELPEDDFENPFEDDPVSEEMTVVRPDGSSETVRVEDAKVISVEEWLKQE